MDKMSNIVFCGISTFQQEPQVHAGCNVDLILSVLNTTVLLVDKNYK